MLAKLSKKLADFQPITIVAFGDSISEVGLNPTYFGGATCGPKNWAAQLRDELAKAFPKSQWTLKHAGIGGQNSYEGLGRFQYTVVPHKPDLVLIAFGANDCGWHEIPPAATTTAQTRMVDEIRHWIPEGDIVMMGTGGENPLDFGMQHVDETVAATRGVAGEKGVLFVDIRAAMLGATGNGERWEDYHNGRRDCHPNDRGHAMWAQAVFDTIRANVRL